MVKTSIFTIKDINRENQFITKQLEKKGLVNKVHRSENEDKVIKYLLKHKSASQKQLFNNLGIRSVGSLSVLLNRLIFDKDVEIFMCECCDSAKKYRLTKTFYIRNNLMLRNTH